MKTEKKKKIMNEICKRIKFKLFNIKIIGT